VDAGPGLVPLLDRFKERDVAPDYVSTLLAAFGPTTTASREELLEPLTRREREILRLMGRGLTNPEIAEALVISPHTVRTHATHIYAKLEVGNRARAVRKARQLGIIS
jgi:LuxR family maltose regulon positive regulatory protein